MGPGWGGALVLEASPVALGCAEDQGKAYQRENCSGRTPHTVRLGPDLTEPGTFLEREGLDKEGRQCPAGLEERLDRSVGLCVVSCGAGKGAVRGLGLHLGRSSGTGLCSGGGLGSVSQRGEGSSAHGPPARSQGEHTPAPTLDVWTSVSWHVGRLALQSIQSSQLWEVGPITPVMHEDIEAGGDDVTAPVTHVCSRDVKLKFHGLQPSCSHLAPRLSHGSRQSLRPRLPPAPSGSAAGFSSLPTPLPEILSFFFFSCPSFYFNVSSHTEQSIHFLE